MTDIANKSCGENIRDSVKPGVVVLAVFPLLFAPLIEKTPQPLRCRFPTL